MKTEEIPCDTDMFLAIDLIIFQGKPEAIWKILSKNVIKERFGAYTHLTKISNSRYFSFGVLTLKIAEERVFEGYGTTARMALIDAGLSVWVDSICSKLIGELKKKGIPKENAFNLVKRI